jgi:hypothetical protein
MDREGVSGARPAHEGEPVEAKEETALQKAGNATFSILTVAVSAAAIAAPFFLF